MFYYVSKKGDMINLVLTLVPHWWKALILIETKSQDRRGWSDLSLIIQHLDIVLESFIFLVNNQKTLKQCILLKKFSNISETQILWHVELTFLLLQMTK